MIQIKSERELEKMRAVGKILSSVLKEVVSTVKPGRTLIELDELAERLAREKGCKPAFQGYLGYQHTLCTSVNEAIVHGIPNKYELQEGDIVGIDFGLILDGFVGDSCITVPVGKISDEAKALCKATYNSLYAAIEAARPGNTLKDLARAIEAEVLPQGYSVVREFVGHGIGRKLHEDPQIPNYVSGAPNLPLRAGMTVALEPMINAGGPEVKVLSDKWTAVTQDGSLSCHYEHTIAVLEDRTEVLTEWGDRPYDGILEELGVL